jgi:hypothetical protein
MAKLRRNDQLEGPGQHDWLQHEPRGASSAEIKRVVHPYARLQQGTVASHQVDRGGERQGRLLECRAHRLIARRNSDPRQTRGQVVRHENRTAQNGSFRPRTSRGKLSEVYTVLFGVLLCQPCHGLGIRLGDVVDGFRGVAEQPREVIANERVRVV